MYAIFALEATGLCAYHVGSRESCALWKRLRRSEAWRQHQQDGRKTVWPPPFLTDVIALQAAQQMLLQCFAQPVELRMSPKIPLWRAYGLDVTATPAQPPELVPFDSDHPVLTGHSVAFLKTSAGVGATGTAGVLADDWRGHPEGSPAIVTQATRNILTFYIQVGSV